MEPFDYKEHVVDVLYEAHGFSFQEALQNAALAMFNVIADVKKVHAENKVEIREEAATLEELTAFTLGNLLSELDSREMFFKNFTVTKLIEKKEGGFDLEGVAEGSDAQPELGGTVVKAVTHHEIKVEKTQFNGREQWKITVLLDI